MESSLWNKKQYLLGVKAVSDSKAGKIDFKVDKYGIIHTAIGKSSFTKEMILDNSKEVLQSIVKLKPSSAKGAYVESVYMSSTMSTSIKIDVASFN